MLTSLFELMRVKLTTLSGVVNNKAKWVVTPLIAGLICSALAATGRHQSLAQSMALMNRMMAGEVSLGPTSAATSIYASFVLERLFAVSLCTTSGLLGGIFSPSLFMGLVFGLFLHSILIQYSMVSGAPSAILVGLLTSSQGTSRNILAVTGAAAVLGGVFRAPLTAAALCSELCNEPSLFLPVLGASWMAAKVATQIKVYLTSKNNKSL